MADSLRKGALYLILAEMLLAGMAALVKHVSQELPSEVVMFYRNALGLIPLLPLLMRPQGLQRMKTRRFGGHLLRAATGLAAMYCYFYTLSCIPLAEAVLVKMTTPFFIPLVALLWLGDRLSRGSVAAILVGFVGVAFILRPMPGHFDPAYLVALLGAVLMSIAMVGIRNISDTEPPQRIVFWFTLMGTVISIPPMLLTGVWPQPHHWVWLLGIGGIATLAQMFMTQAYRYASPGRIGVYNYTSVIWAALLGYLFWHELLHWTTWVGTGLIILAGLGNLHAQRPARSN